VGTLLKAFREDCFVFAICNSFENNSSFSLFLQPMEPPLLIQIFNASTPEAASLLWAPSNFVTGVVVGIVVGVVIVVVLICCSGLVYFTAYSKYKQRDRDENKNRSDAYRLWRYSRDLDLSTMSLLKAEDSQIKEKEVEDEEHEGADRHDNLNDEQEGADKHDNNNNVKMGGDDKMKIEVDKMANKLVTEETDHIEIKCEPEQEEMNHEKEDRSRLMEHHGQVEEERVNLDESTNIGPTKINYIQVKIDGSFDGREDSVDKDVDEDEDADIR